MTTTLRRISKRAGRWGEVDEDFDTAVADVIYERIMKCEDNQTAALYSALLVSGALQCDLAVHSEEIGKALHQQVSTQVGQVRDSLAKAAVAHHKAGDVAAADAAIEHLGQVITLSKAFGGNDYSPQARAERARHQTRDVASGKFVQMHHKVEYSPDVRDPRTKPLDDRTASRLGIHPHETHLTAEQKKHYQEAYAQIAAAVAPYAHLPRGASEMRLNYDDGASTLHDVPKSVHDKIPINGKKRLYSVEVSSIPGPAGLEHSPLDALGLMGRNALHHGALNTGDLRGYREAIDTTDPTGNEEFIPSNKAFRRVAAGSQLLEQTLGPVAPPKLRTALAVGRHMGEYGPEAQRVIGPTADKIAYRYRGTERKPDARLQTAVDAVIMDPRLKGSAKREFMVRGAEAHDGVWSPSPVLNYFRSRLPKQQLNRLQLASGRVPPSEGVLIDRNGRVAAQAVGYADDHYLPFNLKNLSKLKGGEYIRTRSWGGPTTEDIYTGLVGGAKAMTVVSHSGAYTVEFDDSLRGTRRYNDKAARMVARYGQLLDAVQSEQVTTGLIDPHRMSELEAKARKTADPTRNEERYKTELRRLVINERRDPQLSKEQKVVAAEEWVAREAAGRRTRDGAEMTTTELVDDIARRKGGAAMSEHARAHGGAAGTLTDYAGAERRLLHDESDPVKTARNVAAALGKEGSFDKHMERTEKEYKAGLRPLRLNGAGYLTAMEALQEQFPYYIKSVSYHPWADAAIGMKDTGYVKPKHNRPAEALSGYFDRSINGRSKVHADSIRHQNRRVNGSRLREHQSEEQKLRNEQKGPADHKRGGSASAADTAVLREAADLDLLAAFRDPELRFGEKLRAGGRLANMKQTDADALKGTPVAGQIENLRAHAPTFYKLVTGDEAELTRDPVRLNRDLAAAMREVDANGLVDLPEEKVRAHKAGGREADQQQLGDVGAMLRNPSGKWNLAELGDVFDPNVEVGTRDLADAYHDDDKIELIRHELPDNLDHPDWLNAAGRVKARLTQARADRARWAANGARGAEPALGEDDIADQTEALVRAHALRARWSEAARRDQAAKEREAAQAEARQPQHIEVHHEPRVHVHGPGSDASRAAEDVDWSRVIEGRTDDDE